MIEAAKYKNELKLLNVEASSVAVEVVGTVVELMVKVLEVVVVVKVWMGRWGDFGAEQW